MTREFAISELALGGGRVALCPMPGAAGGYGADLARILAWRPAMVVTLATEPEMVDAGAAGLPGDLAREGIAWCHLPVPDFAAESVALMLDWRTVSNMASSWPLCAMTRVPARTLISSQSSLESAVPCVRWCPSFRVRTTASSR